MEQIITNWNRAKVCFIIGTLFWLIETIYFLIAYGWHWKAINLSEQICDCIACAFWIAGMVFLTMAIIDLLGKIKNINNGKN